MADSTDIIVKFKKAAARPGTSVCVVETASDAVNYIISIVKDKHIQTVIKANSAIAEKLTLNERLAEAGVRVIETSVVQLIAQLAKGQEVPIEKAAALISSTAGKKVKPEPAIVLEKARQVLKEAYHKADLGITEADLGIAETGTLIILENEENARLAAVLPRIHLTLLDCNSIAADLAEAAEKLKGSSEGIPGRKVSTFITYLTRRNTAEEISGETQTKEPVEEHVLLVNLP
ncbi:MAG: lactate utilization protein [Dehalococcoidia bacterium]|nr:lactate utilization protein [Dehalococcoidia bacterium]